MGVYMKNLGCFLSNVVMSLEFMMVQMYLNVYDYFLKVPFVKTTKIVLHCYRLINSQSKDS